MISLSVESVYNASWENYDFAITGYLLGPMPEFYLVDKNNDARYIVIQHSNLWNIIKAKIKTLKNASEIFESAVIYGKLNKYEEVLHIDNLVLLIIELSGEPPYNFEFVKHQSPLRRYE